MRFMCVREHDVYYFSSYIFSGGDKIPWRKLLGFVPEFLLFVASDIAQRLYVRLTGLVRLVVNYILSK